MCCLKVLNPLVVDVANAAGKKHVDGVAVVFHVGVALFDFLVGRVLHDVTFNNINKLPAPVPEIDDPLEMFSHKVDDSGTHLLHAVTKIRQTRHDEVLPTTHNLVNDSVWTFAIALVTG